MFKVISLEYYDHPFFHDTRIQFVGVNEENAADYVSLIIGPNGTGKSKILLSLIEIFNSLDRIIRDHSANYSFAYQYKLEYTHNGQHFTIIYSDNVLIINGEESGQARRHLLLPTKVLISAFSFNDKYPLREQRGRVKNPNYHYLGLKSTTNNIFIGNPTKTAISNLYEAVLQGKDITPLRAAFVTLGLKPSLTLVYKPGKHFDFLQDNGFAENRSIDYLQFTERFRLFYRQNSRRRSEPQLKRLGNEKIERILSQQENIENLIEFLRRNVLTINNTTNKEIQFNPVLDFDDPQSFGAFVTQVLPFQLLSDLEIASFQRFEVMKINSNFSFDESSSGEYHIILTFLNILSLVEDNSLVMLDEPEISLHPNWQIKYMEVFTNIFSHFSNCHYIIASHSHFLVSDLKSSSSNITSIDVGREGKIMVKPYTKDTYGWSAEQILLDVFNVATTRNYYLTRIVGNILDEISHADSDQASIRNKITALRRFDLDHLNENDPMKIVIQKLLNKIRD